MRGALLWMVVVYPLAAEPPTLAPVRYGQLGEAIRVERGSIVLVDFWATYCMPCRKKLPDAMRLTRKYADQGVRVVTVSLDDAEHATEARQILTSQGFTGRHLRLAEEPQFWQDKLHAVGPPMVYLFDRSGRLVHAWTQGEDFGQIEERIQRLLATEKAP